MGRRAREEDREGEEKKVQVKEKEKGEQRKGNN